MVDNEVQIVLALLMSPSDIAVSRGTLPGTGAKSEQGQGLLSGADKITQLRPGQGFVSQVMIPMNEFIP